MAYRVNVQFKDGSTNSHLAEAVVAAPPRRGDTISVARGGQPVAVQVTAIWTPSAKLRGDGLVMVEAREI
jgi:hypothetical protein